MLYVENCLIDENLIIIYFFENVEILDFYINI